MMRRVGVVDLAGLGLLAATSCSDGEDAVDLSDVEADVGGTMEVDDGQVVTISPNGAVVVSDGDELCVHELDGTERGCTTITTGSVGPSDPGSWSPDGNRLAFGALAQMSRMEPTSISVLDAEDVSLDVVVEAEDVTTLDAFPMWASDDELRFVRVERDDPVGTELVTVEANGGGDESAVDMADEFAFRLIGVGSRPFGDRTVYVERGRGEVSVIAVDEDGADDRLVRLDGSHATIGGIDAEGEHMVVSGFDAVRLVAGPAIYLEADRENDEIESPFDVVSATLDPTGAIVAAAVVDSATDDDAELVLWDPATGDEVELGTMPYALQMRWLDDDRLVAWNLREWTVVTLAS